MDRDQLLNNSSHGSMRLVREFLLHIIQHDLTGDGLMSLTNDFKNAYPDMALVDKITSKIQRSSDPVETAKAQLNRLEKGPEDLSSEIIARFKPNPTVLTFSHSQTVVDVLEQLNPQQIYCLLSIPGGEGRIMAKETGGLLISHKEIIQIINLVDLLLLGCDSYTDEIFVNKIGTNDILDLMKLYDIPVVVVSQMEKKMTNIEAINSDLFEPNSLDNVTLLAY